MTDCERHWRYLTLASFDEAVDGILEAAVIGSGGIPTGVSYLVATELRAREHLRRDSIFWRKAHNHHTNVPQTYLHAARTLVQHSIREMINDNELTFPIPC